MTKIKYDKERMRKACKQITSEAAKGLYSVIPIVISAVADGIGKGFENRISKSIDSGNSTYASAINAIAKSDMSSYYQDQAIQAINKNGTSDYYAAIESIASSNGMSSYYRCESIVNISK